MGLEATAVLFSASSLSFSSVNSITHEPLNLAWYNCARTSTSTTSRTLLNIKVIGQMSRSQEFLVGFCVHDTAWTSWSGFTKCCTGMALDTPLRLVEYADPWTNVTYTGVKNVVLSLVQHWATRGQYLALSKSWHSCYTLLSDGRQIGERILVCSVQKFGNAWRSGVYWQDGNPSTYRWWDSLGPNEYVRCIRYTRYGFGDTSCSTQYQYTCKMSAVGTSNSHIYYALSIIL